MRNGSISHLLTLVVMVVTSAGELKDAVCGLGYGQWWLPAEVRQGGVGLVEL